MAGTNRDSDLSAPLNEANYADNAFLTSNAASQGDDSFPTANPPPKTNHSRTASDSTKVSSALNQPLNIVVLGASFAGLSVGHAFLDTTLAQLRRAVTWDNDAHTIEIELMSSAAEKRYSQLSTTSGAQKRKSDNPLTLMLDSPRTQTIPYHALIIATGSSAHSNLLSLHGPHADTIAALASIHSKLAAAKSIIVCGGGTSGIETAGQLATYLNYTRHWPIRRLKSTPKKIVLITGSARCLPSFPLKQSKKAERKLQSLGVDIRHNVRVTSVREDFDLTGQVKVELDDETSLIVDAYIPCTGVSPNSAYAPPALRDADGYIKTNASTCRVDEAGPRVYALGDVASFSQDYILDAYAAVPVVQANLLRDLVVHELRLASPYGGNQDAIDTLQDKVYVGRDKDSQLCLVTRFGGVGLDGTWVAKSVGA